MIENIFKLSSYLIHKKEKLIWCKYHNSISWVHCLLSNGIDIFVHLSFALRAC